MREKIAVLVSCLVIQTIRAEEPSTSISLPLAAQREAAIPLIINLRELYSDPPLSTAKINLYLKPTSVSMHESENANVAEYQFGGNRNGISARFLDFKKSPEREFFLYLDYSGICITRNTIFSEFGNNYKPTYDVLVEGWPSEDKISDEIKVNMKVFGFGPKYSLQKDGERVTAIFRFIFLACADHVYLVNK